MRDSLLPRATVTRATVMVRWPAAGPRSVGEGEPNALYCSDETSSWDAVDGKGYARPFREDER